MNDIKLKKPSATTRVAAMIFLSLALAVTSFYIYFRTQENEGPKSAADFGFEDIESPLDADNDGIDDWTDIMLGARAYIETNPVYSSGYYEGGYPPDGEGVCTDVIWKAFAAAGYNLKDLVDADIAANRDAYPKATDSNIDFRRVRNLSVFFERNAVSLPTSLKDPEDWMPGDIVVTEDHIAICSDKRNSDGLPYLIHLANRTAGAVEGDRLAALSITGHYRWWPEP